MNSKEFIDYVMEGLERNQGKMKPGETSGQDSKKDPGFGSRRETVATCTGYTDPKTGKKVVANGHKAKFTVFTQDLHQTGRCDACQVEYRKSYKSAHAMAKANRKPFTPFGGNE